MAWDISVCLRKADVTSISLATQHKHSWYISEFKKA